MAEYGFPDFDPYYKWLGIPPAEQPANHYRLLGLKLWESDPEVIANAADRQMAHVKTYALGQYSDTSQQILDELARAKVCLLNPAAKARYDTQLGRERRPLVQIDSPSVQPQLSVSEDSPTDFPGDWQPQNFAIGPRIALRTNGHARRERNRILLLGTVFVFLVVGIVLLIASQQPERLSDAPQSMSISVKATDGSEVGPVDGVFQIMLSPALTEDLRFTFELEGTAEIGTDYQIDGPGVRSRGTGGTVVLPHGKQVAEIRVRVLEDEIVEGPETVNLKLWITSEDADRANVSIQGGVLTANLKIIDKNRATVSVHPVRRPTGFELRQSLPSSEDTIIEYEYRDPSMQSSIRRQATIPSGQTLHRVDLHPTQAEEGKYEAKLTQIVKSNPGIQIVSEARLASWSYELSKSEPSIRPTVERHAKLHLLPQYIELPDPDAEERSAVKLLEVGEVDSLSLIALSDEVELSGDDSINWRGNSVAILRIYERQLEFRWVGEVSSEAERFLRNALIKLQADGVDHMVALREPERPEHFSFDLKRSDQTLRSTVKYPPPPEHVRFALDLSHLPPHQLTWHQGNDLGLLQAGDELVLEYDASKVVSTLKIVRASNRLDATFQTIYDLPFDAGLPLRWNKLNEVDRKIKRDLDSARQLQIALPGMRANLRTLQTRQAQLRRNVPANNNLALNQNILQLQQSINRAQTKISNVPRFQQELNELDKVVDLAKEIDGANVPFRAYIDLNGHEVDLIVSEPEAGTK